MSRPRARSRTRRSAFAVTVLAATVLGACGAVPRPTVEAVPDGSGTGLVARVGHVTDGDTVTLAFAGHPEESVRLLGIDTPETVKPGAPVECFGPEASAATRALLPPGTEVVVQRDLEARDRYGRLLLYVWRRHDGLFVNRALLETGHATTLSYAPNTSRRSELAGAARQARERRTGLWGACEPSQGR
jgi:micrococcal nuclease